MYVDSLVYSLSVNFIGQSFGIVGVGGRQYTFYQFVMCADRARSCAFL